MRIHKLHPWNLTLENAKAIQRNLRAWIVTEGACPEPKMLGRIHVTSSDETQHSATIQARITITDRASGTLLERKVAIKTTKFPLQAGMKSFRKMPAIIAALEKLNRVPDVFICDGFGITSETSFGVASHVGLVTSVPTIGVCHTRGHQPNTALAMERGSHLPAGDGVVGAMTRVLTGVDPLLICPAHKIGQQEAMDIILNYIPANTPIRDYLQAIYRETGNNKDTPVKLKLVKSGTN
jgi:deoxyribonuclease V